MKVQIQRKLETKQGILGDNIRASSTIAALLNEKERELAEKYPSLDSHDEIPRDFQGVRFKRWLVGTLSYFEVAVETDQRNLGALIAFENRVVDTLKAAIEYLYFLNGWEASFTVNISEPDTGE